jgi:hypothetical protein
MKRVQNFESSESTNPTTHRMTSEKNRIFEKVSVKVANGIADVTG